MSIIGRTRELLVEHYVLPDTSSPTSPQGWTHCSPRPASGAYVVASPEELGAVVTEDLQSVNGDRHLWLTFHTCEVLGGDSAVRQEIAREFSPSRHAPRR